MNINNDLDRIATILCPIAAAIMTGYVGGIYAGLAVYFAIAAIQATTYQTHNHFQVGNQKPTEVSHEAGSRYKAIGKGDEFLDLPYTSKPVDPCGRGRPHS